MNRYATQVDWLAFSNCVLVGLWETVTMFEFWKSLIDRLVYWNHPNEMASALMVFCGHVKDPQETICSNCGFPVEHFR